MKFVYSFLLFCLIFTACNNNADHTGSSSNADTLLYQYDTYLLQSKHVIDNEDKKDTTYFKAHYPIFEDEEINKLVARQFTANNNPDTQYNTIQEEAKAFIENFDDFIKMDEYPRSWFTDLKAKVLQNTSNYLAVSVETSDYTGGAHGNYATLFFNYDVVKKDTIGLETIIPVSKQQELTHIAEAIFRKQEGLTPEQPLDESYFFEDSIFHLNSNFTLTPKGLLFLYNVYEIKPYAAGTTELLIPYQQIDSFITDQGKLIYKQLK